MYSPQVLESAPQPSAIRQVLDQRQMRMVYQPIVDLRTRLVYAYEALVRSTSPLFTSPPALFDAAVKEGCVGELGRVLRQMSVTLCPNFPLFLNIHPNELGEGWLVRPDDPIFAHGEQVFLEITESVPLTHFEQCHNMLREVRGKGGIHLVVDDLGAGYSNLKYIADLTPDVVKLDRELIAGLTRESRLHTLVTAITKLCVDLGAQVVAEGIETVEELDACMAAGARYGQGYLLARPAYPPPDSVWPSI